MSSAVKMVDFAHNLPLLFVAFWACVVLLAATLGAEKSNRLGPLSILGLAGGLGLCVWSWIVHPTGVSTFGGMILVDRFSLFLDSVVVLAALFTLLFSG
ncbi:MAG: hypothetical protein V1754_04560, partial [Pseudomonadota bacterium]